jgi:hypothetical protein
MTGARGEAIVRVGNEEHRVLLTTRALADAEQATGKSVLALARDAAQQDLALHDVAHLLRAGLEAARRDARTGARPVTLDDAYDLIDQVGFSRAVSAVFEAMAVVLQYQGEEDEPGPPVVPARS